MEYGNLGTIWAGMGMDHANFDQGVEQVSKKTAWLDRETQAHVTRIGQNFTQLGRTMSIGVTAPLALLGRQMVNTFAEFQQSMQNTASVAQASTGEMIQLSTAARDAGASTQYSATQAANSLYFLASAGMDATQSVGALNGVLALAAATQSDLAYTAESMASAISQFNLEAEEASRVANVYSAAIANSQATMQKLTDSMRYAGPIAAGFGMSIEETTSALMGLYNAGLQGEQAGTTLRRALQELSAPTGQATEVLKELEISLSQVNPEMNSMAEIMHTLNEAGITTSQTMRLFGAQAGSGMGALLRQGSDAIRELEREITGTDTAAKMAEMQMDTLTGSVKIMKSVYQELSITLMESFEPALRQIVEQGTEVLRWFTDLDPAAQRMIVTFGGLAASAGPVLLVMGQLAKALPLLMGPAGVIFAGVAAVTALGFAFAGAKKDIRDFYNESVATSRATQDQAIQLERLVAQYKELAGKPDKSALEHEKLEKIMQAIVKIQPLVAAGFDDIGTAIESNIDQLDRYVQQLKTQSELELRVASLDYLHRRTQLERELNNLLDEQNRLEQQAQGQANKASKVGVLSADLQKTFYAWQEANKSGLQETADALEKDMRRMFAEIDPVYQTRGDAPFSQWMLEVADAAGRAVGDTNKLMEQLRGVGQEISRVNEIQKIGEEVLQELERRRSGFYEQAEPASTSNVGTINDELQEVIRTTKEIEDEISRTADSFKSKIDLIKYAGDSFGDLSKMQAEYMDFLKTQVFEETLDVTEGFRARLAREMHSISEEINEAGKNMIDDITKPVTDRMRTWDSQINLIRLGIEQYVDEFGDLEHHMQQYSMWLGKQLTNGALEATIHEQIALTKNKIDEELVAIKNKVALSATDIMNKIMGMTDAYGPMAGRLRNAINLGQIHIDAKDLIETEKRVENFYQYLVEAGQVDLSSQLAVANYQLDNLQAGSVAWLQTQREIWKLEKEMQEPSKVNKPEGPNEALRNQLATFEQLKHENSELVDSYQKQHEWLSKNIVQQDGIIRSTQEQMDIENEIFALRMAHFTQTATTENWTAEERQANLEQYVTAHASSFEQIRTVRNLERQLDMQIAQEKDQDYNAAIRRYHEETRIRKYTLEEQANLFESIMTEMVPITRRTQEATRAIEIQQQIFTRQLGERRISDAQEVMDREQMLQVQRLKNAERFRDAEELESYIAYQRETRRAENSQELMEVAYQAHQEKLLAIARRYDDMQVRSAQETAYRVAEIKIQQLENDEQYYEAAEQRSLLQLQRERDRHYNNQDMLELADQAHHERMIALKKDFANKAMQKSIQATRDEIQAMGNLRNLDLDHARGWIEEKLQALEGSGAQALQVILSFQEQVANEDERRKEEAKRAEEEWQKFLVDSRQLQSYQLKKQKLNDLQAEMDALKAQGMESVELEREIQRAKHELAKQALEDQLAILEIMDIHDQISPEQRLRYISSIREGYQELYGDLFEFDEKWQQIRRQEIEMERAVAEKQAQDNIQSIQANERSISSLRKKEQALKQFIFTTDEQIKQQEYLNELTNTQAQIQNLSSSALDFLGRLNPEMGKAVRSWSEWQDILENAPQHFENLRSHMQELFGEAGGDMMAGITGGLAGAQGGYIGAISGMLAGFGIGGPWTAGIAAGASLIGSLFDPGNVPQDAQRLKSSIEAINESLKDFGVAYRSAELEISKKSFLGIQYGWNITNEEAAKQGYEIGGRMVESMNASMQTLGGAFASTIRNNGTWEDFEKTLGDQLRRIMLQEIMAAAAFEEEAKQIVGMMQTAAAGGFDQGEIEEIKKRWQLLLDSIQKPWEEFSRDFEEFFPDSDVNVNHQVRGVQINRLSGRDRDFFGEMLRPISALDRLPGLLEKQLGDIFQTYEHAEGIMIEASQVIMEHVARVEFTGNIENINVNGERMEIAIRNQIEALSREALDSTRLKGG